MEELKRKGVCIVIDYFSATFPFICYEEDSEYKIIDEIILMICDFFNIKKTDISKDEYSMHRFLYQYKLSEHITLRLCGPELKSGHKSCQVELSGQGCREFEELAEDKTWIDKYLTLNKVITPAAYKAKQGDSRYDRFYALRGEGWEYN